MSVSWRFGIITQNMFSEPTNSPGVNYEGILTMHVADFLLRTPQPSVELLPVYREEMRIVVIELNMSTALYHII